MANLIAIGLLANVLAAVSSEYSFVERNSLGSKVKAMVMVISYTPALGVLQFEWLT
jgi:hypothetical protein